MALAPVPPRIPDARNPVFDDNGHFLREWYSALANLVAFVLQLAPTYLQNTHAKRLATSAANYPDGTLFYETDRTIYYIARGKNWVYDHGNYPINQQALPTDLGISDTGFLAYVTDFAHLLQWTGTGWNWAPGEQGAGMQILFPDVVPSLGWHVCDGAAGIQVLQSDGSYILVTMPNIGATTFYRQ